MEKKSKLSILTNGIIRENPTLERKVSSRY